MMVEVRCRSWFQYVYVPVSVLYRPEIAVFARILRNLQLENMLVGIKGLTIFPSRNVRAIPFRHIYCSADQGPWTKGIE